MRGVAVICTEKFATRKFYEWFMRINKVARMLSPRRITTDEADYFLITEICDCRGLSIHEYFIINEIGIASIELIDEVNERIKRTRYFENTQREQVQGIARAMEEVARFAKEYTFKWELPLVRKEYVVKVNMQDLNNETQSRKEIYKMLSCCSQKVEDSLRVMFNKPATVLFVGDEKFVSKCHNEEYNETKGFLMCFAKFFNCTHSHIKSLLKHRGMEGNPNAELMFLYDFANLHGLSDAQIKAIVDEWSKKSAEQLKVATAKKQEKAAKKNDKKKATAGTEKTKNKNIKTKKKED